MHFGPDVIAAGSLYCACCRVLALSTRRDVAARAFAGVRPSYFGIKPHFEGENVARLEACVSGIEAVFRAYEMDAEAAERAAERDVAAARGAGALSATQQQQQQQQQQVPQEKAVKDATHACSASVAAANAPGQFEVGSIAILPPTSAEAAET